MSQECRRSRGTGAELWQGQASQGTGQQLLFTIPPNWHKDPTSSTESPVGHGREDRREHGDTDGHHTSFLPSHPKQRGCWESPLELGQVGRGQEDSREMTREATGAAFLWGPLSSTD